MNFTILIFYVKFIDEKPVETTHIEKGVVASSFEEAVGKAYFQFKESYPDCAVTEMVSKEI